jgi:hypothetical protein
LLSIVGSLACGPALPARSPASSPLSREAKEAPVPEIAASLRRDPLALPVQADAGAAGPHSGHDHHHPHSGARP